MNGVINKHIIHMKEERKEEDSGCKTNYKNLNKNILIYQIKGTVNFYQVTDMSLVTVLSKNR